MKRIKFCIGYLFNNIRGASATEYGVIIAGVALALIFVFGTLTGALNEGFLFIKDTVLSAFGG